MTFIHSCLIMLDGYLGNVLESLYVDIKLLKSFPLCVRSSVVVRICSSLFWLCRRCIIHSPSWLLLLEHCFYFNLWVICCVFLVMFGWAWMCGHTFLISLVLISWGWGCEFLNDIDFSRMYKQRCLSCMHEY